MKVTLKRKALSEAMGLALGAVASRTTKPILSSVKATASGDTLTLTATDLEVSIRTEVPAEVRGAGVAILSQSLAAVLKAADEDEVAIHATERGVTVRIGGSRYELPAFPADEFPDAPDADEANYHEVIAADLRRLIRLTVFAVDKRDSTRFALAGVLWDLDGDRLRLVATDSKRLAVAECAAHVAGTMPKGQHLVPPKALALLAGCLADSEGDVRIVLRPNEAQFRVGGTTIHTRLLEGRYPPYRDILKTTAQAAHKIGLPAESFAGKLRAAATMADKESSRADFAFAPGRLTIRAKGTETGSSEVVMDLPECSDSAAIAFDPRFLSEFLRAVKGEPTVQVELLDGSKPGLFRCGDYQYLVMPLAG